MKYTRNIPEIIPCEVRNILWNIPEIYLIQLLRLGHPPKYTRNIPFEKTKYTMKYTRNIPKYTFPWWTLPEGPRGVAPTLPEFGWKRSRGKDSKGMLLKALSARSPPMIGVWVRNEGRWAMASCDGNWRMAGVRVRK
jgi:hypothetical protein